MIKKIWANSIENLSVLFEHTNVKVDISAHSPTKKHVFKLFKEKCTKINVVKRLLRAIEGWNNFYLHVY